MAQFFQYKVKRGQTPQTIAQQYRITPEQILRANPGGAPFTTGQTIRIPGGGKPMFSPLAGGGAPPDPLKNFRRVGTSILNSLRPLGEAFQVASSGVSSAGRGLSAAFPNAGKSEVGFGAGALSGRVPAPGSLVPANYDPNRYQTPAWYQAQGRDVPSDVGQRAFVSAPSIQTTPQRPIESNPKLTDQYGLRVNPVTGFSSARGNTSQMIDLDLGNGNFTSIPAIMTASDFRNTAASLALGWTTAAQQLGYTKFGGTYVYVGSEVSGADKGPSNQRGGDSGRFFQYRGEKSGGFVRGRGGDRNWGRGGRRVGGKHKDEGGGGGRGGSPASSSDIPDIGASKPGVFNV